MDEKGRMNVIRQRNRFSVEEDQIILDLINEIGTTDWEMISKLMPGRNKRQVRERWINYLRPDLNKKPWTKEEEELLLKKHIEHGNKWKSLSIFFPNRTEICVKCKYQQLIRQKKKKEPKFKKCTKKMSIEDAKHNVVPNDPNKLCNVDKPIISTKHEDIYSNFHMNQIKLFDADPELNEFIELVWL